MFPLPFLLEEAEEFLLSPMVGIPEMVRFRYLELVRLSLHAPWGCWVAEEEEEEVVEGKEEAPPVPGANRAEVEAEVPTIVCSSSRWPCMGEDGGGARHSQDEQTARVLCMYRFY